MMTMKLREIHGKRESHPSWHSAELNACAQGCRDAHDAALIAMSQIVGSPGEWADRIRALEDAIQLTQVAADFILRGSDFQLIACDACADVCDACATDLASMQPSPEQADFNATIDRLRMCADACRRLSRSRAA